VNRLVHLAVRANPERDAIGFKAVYQDHDGPQPTDHWRLLTITLRFSLSGVEHSVARILNLFVHD
jgi:hypothetical protein